MEGHPTSAAAKARKRSGGSNSTRPQIKREKSDKSREERAVARAVIKLGGPEIAAVHKQQFAELEKNRQPVGCVHDTSDGFLIAMIVKGLSQIEIRRFFKVGGYRYKRLCDEMKHPELRAQKLIPKVPRHAYSEDDKKT